MPGTEPLPSHAMRQARINRDRLKFYRERLPTTAATNLLVGGTYALICAFEGIVDGLATWLMALYAVTFARVVTTLAATRGERGDGTAAIRIHTGLVVCSGLIWGSLPLVFASPDFPYLLALQALILAGMISGATGQLAWHFPSYVLYSLACVTPATYLMLRHPDIQYRYIGFTAFIFMGFSIYHAHQFNRNLLNNFRLRYSNLDLIRRLEEQNRRLADLIAELESAGIPQRGTE